MNKKKKEKKPIHLSVDFPCPKCGYLEFWCDEDGVDGEIEWTDDPKKCTCKDCLYEYGAE